MRSRFIVPALLATLALPVRTYAEPPRDGLDRSDEADRFDDPLFITGAITFGASYGAAVGAAAGSLDRDQRALYVPVVGPWIALAANHPCDGDCADDTRDDVLLVIDGVVQAAGVALAVTSLATHGDDRDNGRGMHLAITGRSIGVTGRF